MRLFFVALAMVTAGCVISGPVGGTAADAPTRTDLAGVVSRAETEGFSGAVLVVRDGRVLLDQGVGSIRGQRLRVTSRFRIASAGKQFTAAALLLCAERGLLSLDSRLGHVLPNVPADKAAITMRQILSYTSGLPASDAGEDAPSADAAVAAILALPLAAQPGERFIYSNANYLLAAAIVEHVTRTPFLQFLRRDVLDPVGLVDTGQVLTDSIDASIASVSGEIPPQLRRPAWPALAYYSTTHDIWRWIDVLNSSRLLPRESAAQLFQPVAPIQEGSSALGWFVGVAPHGAQRIFTRGNEDFGANCSIYYYPAQKVLIVVLTHAGNASDDMSWSRTLQQRLEAVLLL
jgi:CubicO group peptidase (beta-lactamase class C family)